MLIYNEIKKFLRLLTTTQLQYQASNTFSLEQLFESKHLQEAAKETYIIFSTLIINQLRYTISDINNSTVWRTVTINQ